MYSTSVPVCIFLSLPTSGDGVLNGNVLIAILTVFTVNRDFFARGSFHWSA